MQTYHFLEENFLNRPLAYEKLRNDWEPLRTPIWEVKFIDPIGVSSHSNPKIPFNIKLKRILSALHNTQIITRNIFINMEYDKQ